MRCVHRLRAAVVLRPSTRTAGQSRCPPVSGSSAIWCRHARTFAVSAVTALTQLDDAATVTSSLSHATPPAPTISDVPSVQLSQPRLILGLDLNTNSSGYAVIDHRGQYLDAGYIDTSSKAIDNNLFDRVLLVNQHLLAVRQRHDPHHTQQWNVSIEEYLRMLGNQSYHTASLFKLAELNAMITLLASQTFSARPVRYHPNTVRSRFALKCQLSKAERVLQKTTIKHLVHQFVQPMFPSNFQWPVKKKRTDVLSEHAYDISDAMLVALATLHTMAETEAVERESCAMDKLETALSSGGQPRFATLS